MRCTAASERSEIIGRRRTWLVILLAYAIGLSFTARVDAAVTFVQSNFAVPQTSVSSVTVTFTGTQTAANLNVVVVGWHDSAATVSSVVDSKGNAYAIAVGPTVSSTHGSETIYYAANIVAAAANANTVTVTFSASASKPDVRIAEYSGIVTSSPVDKTAATVGTTGTAASSGSVTTTYANDLIVGADIAGTTTSVAGSGYTQRILTTTDKDILEDKTVTVTGSNSTTATLTASSWWIMQMAAFKAKDTTAPTAPTALTGTVISPVQVNLSWTASTDNIGVTAYLVERCQGASCSSFAQIASVSSGTTYNNTGLTPSTSYSYRVRATDAAGNFSAYSSTVTKVTTADTSAPTAPTALTATAASATQINLSWTASTDNVGVTGYRVERCSGGSCSTFTQIASPTTTTYSDSPLSPSTSYSYRVRATDAAGNLSSYSSTSTVSTPTDTTAPTAPTGLTATGPTATQLSLSWTASTDNVGVTGYRVERCSGASCSTFAQIATPTATSYTDSGLTPSTSYSYRVRATDAAGNLSGYSTTATASTTADTTAPTAPTGLVLSGATATQLVLNWTASTDNVGVTGYRVERCSGASCSSFAQIAVPTATTYSDSALTPSTSYSYRVRATDAAGNLSGYSSTATSSTTADTSAPTAPTGLTASGATMTQLSLSWTASTDNVGVTGYVIQRCAGSGCSSFAQVGTSVTPSYNDSGLTPNTSYSYRVQGTDAAANLGAFSTVASATTLADTQAPTAPSGLTATAASSSQINLSWTASTDNVAVTGYRVERCSGASCSSFAQVGAPTTTTYSDTGLTGATSYSYRIRATDAAANLSSYSSTATVSTPPTITTSTYIYDATGHLKTITTLSGSTTQYTYDAAGNLISVQVTP